MIGNIIRCQTSDELAPQEVVRKDHSTIRLVDQVEDDGARGKQPSDLLGGHGLRAGGPLVSPLLNGVEEVSQQSAVVLGVYSQSMQWLPAGHVADSTLSGRLCAAMTVAGRSSIATSSRGVDATRA